MTVTMHLCCPLTVKIPAGREAKLSHLYNVRPVFRHQTTSVHTLCITESEPLCNKKQSYINYYIHETSGLPLMIDVKLGNFEYEQLYDKKRKLKTACRGHHHDQKLQLYFLHVSITS